MITCLTVFSQGWVKTAELDSVRYTEILNYGKSTYIFTNNYDKVFVVGIQRSTDDGVTWDTLISNNPERFEEESPTAFELINENTALVSYGKNGDIFRYNFTENSIEHFKLEATGSINAIKMLDENNGICGSNIELFITEDGWITNKKIDVLDLEEVYISEEKGSFIYSYLTANDYLEEEMIYYRSSDNGVTWNETSIGNVQGKDMLIKEDETILITANFYEKVQDEFISTDLIFKSTDKGKTWVEKLSLSTNKLLDLGDIKFFSNDVGIACGNNSSIYLTYDGGETWIKQIVGNIESLDRKPTYGGFTQTKFVLGVWNNGLYQKSITTSSVNSEELTSKYQYSLSDNILNFHNHKSINFEIYNIAGQQFGQGQVYDNINLTQLEKGVYLINLNNEFTVKFIK